MDPKQLFFDDRHIVNCAYCGSPIESRDHVPSKVLLDKPYPYQLPVVGSCLSCNKGFSLDEEWFACFVECCICGTTDPDRLNREKIKRIILRRPKLKNLLRQACYKDLFGRPYWHVDQKRVENVVLKLAQGHIAYDLYPRPYAPDGIQVRPLCCLSESDLASFENTGSYFAAWPEIGTRAFLRTTSFAVDDFLDPTGWVVVQPGRYRYFVEEDDGCTVKIVMSEYLACVVHWDF